MHPLTTLFRLALALLALAVVPGARADDPLDGALEIRSAYAVPSHGVIVLTARIAYPQNEQLSASLKDGITLTFDLECIVSRHRHLWFDAVAADLVRRRELSYHVVTDRYLLRERNGRWRWIRSCPAMSNGRSPCAPVCGAATCPTPCAC